MNSVRPQQFIFKGIKEQIDILRNGIPGFEKKEVDGTLLKHILDGNVPSNVHYCAIPYWKALGRKDSRPADRVIAVNKTLDLLAQNSEKYRFLNQCDRLMEQKDCFIPTTNLERVIKEYWEHQRKDILLLPVIPEFITSGFESLQFQYVSFSGQNKVAAGIDGTAILLNAHPEYLEQDIPLRFACGGSHFAITHGHSNPYFTFSNRKLELVFSSS